MPVQSVSLHNPPPYQATLSRLLHSPYIKKNVAIADKTEAKKQGGEYTKKLQSLMKMSEIYNKIIPRLHGYSVSQMREADGVYPNKGQYADPKIFPNSGWIQSKPTSLHQLDALSTIDRLNYGQKDLKHKGESILSKLVFDAAGTRLAQEKANDGGEYGRKERHIEAFNKQIIEHLKEYNELDKLKERDDPISKLARTQIENIYNRLDYLTDDKKLEELTGVDLWENDTKKKYFIERLLPSPLNEKGEKASWFMRPDTDVATAINPKNSDFWAYTAPHVLDSPLSYYMDKKTKKLSSDPIDFLSPYRGLSETAKNLLQSHHHLMKEFTTQNPEMIDNNMREDYLDNVKLWGHRNRPTPIGASGLVNITNMRGDGRAGLHEYRPIGIDLIEQYAHNNTHKSMDYPAFLKKLLNAQSNKNMLSTHNPQPYRPSLPLLNSPLDLDSRVAGLNAFI